MKVFGKCLYITIVVLLSLFLVWLAFLFFIPNSSLFGVKYVSVNETYASKSFDSTDIDSLVLNSKKFNIEFLNSPDNNIFLEVYDNSLGYVPVNSAKSSIEASLQNKLLTFNVKETSGVALKLRSKIRVFIPANKNINISLVNEKAKVTMSNKDLLINDLSYNSNQGTLAMTSGSISGQINLSFEKGMVIFKNVVTNDNNIAISTNNGKLDASTVNFGDITILRNEGGEIKVNSCHKILDETNTSTGTISVSNAESVTINSKSLNINIGSLAGTANITTKSGNINILNAKNEIVLNTTNTNSYISFAKTDYVSRKLDNSNIKNGSLIIDNLDNISLGVDGNAYVKVVMTNVLGNNKILCEDYSRANINLIVNYELAYNLTTSSNKGKVRVNLVQIPEHNGYTTTASTITKVNGGSTDNSLRLSTYYGALNVVDSALVQYSNFI